MKPVDYFQRDVYAFWATTFQFDVKLFDQFLLRRLGHGPLNAVVLCDAANLSLALSQLSEVDEHVVKSANSMYALRGMKVPSGGRFHPKTYLFATKQSVRLLVGSGNLTWSGVDRGAEVFSHFDASNPEGRVVIREWLDWMGGLVESRNDELLHARFKHLRTTLPPLGEPDAPSPSHFATNASTALIETIRESTTAKIEELHVTAPYFDDRAEALRKLIEAIAPSQSVHLYLGARPSVHGPSLQAMLADVEADVHLYRLHPSQFVHAKMIGLIAGSNSVLICGSANLSHAALDRVYTTAGSRGNCEAVVIRSGDAEAIRSRFQLHEAEVTEISLNDLADLTFKSEEEYEADTNVTLGNVALGRDSRLIVKIEGAIPPGAILHAGLSGDLPLQPHESVWLTPVLEKDAIPLIVWISDSESNQISNVVVVDDPEALEQILGERTDNHDIPRELRGERTGSDLTELLLWANRRLIFDIDDTQAAARAAQQAVDDHSGSEGYWDRFAREEIQYDQRSQTYRPLSSHDRSAEPSPLMAQIRAMLSGAPSERNLRRFRNAVLTDSEEGGSSGEWTATAREKTLARNLIRRWARALPDPRHVWLAEDAAARNYEALIELLAWVWLDENFTDAEMVELLGELFSGLLGANQGQGLYGRAEPETAEAVVRSIGEDCKGLAAGMAYCALTNAAWRHFVYDWQYFLSLGLELRVLEPDDLAVAFVEELKHEARTAESITELLSSRARYVDDEMWGTRIAESMGLNRVSLSQAPGFKNVELTVEIDGIADPQIDPRVIFVARRAFEFKQAGSLMILVAERRYLLRLGEKAEMLIDDVHRTSIEPIELERLYAVERQGGNLSDLLGVSAD